MNWFCIVGCCDNNGGGGCVDWGASKDDGMNWDVGIEGPIAFTSPTCFPNLLRPRVWASKYKRKSHYVFFVIL